MNAVHLLQEIIVLCTRTVCGISSFTRGVELACEVQRLFYGNHSSHFDFLAIVLFAPDFSVTHAFVAPAGLVKAAAQYRSHPNAWIIHARESLFEQAGVRDITERVRRVSRTPANTALTDERRVSLAAETKLKARAARG